MLFFFIIISLAYIAWLSRIWVAWEGIDNKQPISNGTLSVSVIVPIRNEADYITRLLSQLTNQNINQLSYEIIVVDDHSTDRSVEIVREFANEHKESIQLIEQQNDKQGKKLALATGIASAKGSIIVTTDGDCSVGDDWIVSMVSPFFDKRIDMVFGGVAIESRRFFERLQAIDFSALIGVGAASWQLGHPNMCNGANIAFRKKIFNDIGGYEGNIEYPSGDDEFLMQKIHKNDPKSVIFMKNPKALVVTYGQPNVASFVQQRIRWAGKWRHHKGLFIKGQAITIFSFYTLWLGCSVWIVTFYSWKIVVFIWMSKWLLDTLFVRSVSQHYRRKIKVFDTFLLSIIYPFYAIGIGLRTIRYEFIWKGRRYG